MDVEGEGGGRGGAASRSADAVCVSFQNDNRFRFGKDLNTRYPINNPIFIGSDQIAEKSDSDTISDTRGRSTGVQVMVLPKEHACCFSSDIFRRIIHVGPSQQVGGDVITTSPPPRREAL